MVVFPLLVQLFNGISRRVSDPKIDCLAEAQQLIAQRCEHDAVLAFMDKTRNKPEIFQDRTLALRLLIEAGSIPALQERHTHMSGVWAQEHFHQQNPCLALTEAAVAYLNGRDFSLGYLAKVAEKEKTHGTPLLEACRKISQCQTTAQLLAILEQEELHAVRHTSEQLAEDIREVVSAHREILRVLRADFLFYRAHACVKQDPQRAQHLITNGQAAGPTELLALNLDINSLVNPHLRNDNDLT